MKNLILVLGCFFFLISCQQTEKEKLEELVKNWNGKEVLFPTNLVLRYMEKLLSILKSLFRIIRS